MKKNPRINPMIRSVVAAFFDSGGRKAWTPLLIASIPVRAAQPAEKARIRRNSVKGADASCRPASGISTGGRCSSDRPIPARTRSPMDPMNR